jgi:putative cell wall-binding protein
MSLKEAINSSLPVAMKDENGNWTWESKVAFAQRLLIHGNNRIAAEECGIPLQTAQGWKQTDWFPQLIEEIKLQHKLGTAHKLNTVVDRALDIIQDRMEHGDYVLNNKTGEIIRKPVALKDATKVATDILGKKIVLEKNDETKAVQQDTVQETLKKLASEFARFNKNISKQNAETIPFVEKV